MTSTTTPARRAPVLHTIVCSTRPGRQGSAFGHWAQQQAATHGGFDARLLELADFGLPVFDEPVPPRHGNYAHVHTRRWSASVEGGRLDAPAEAGPAARAMLDELLRWAQVLPALRR